ncbi:MAG: hypothetical protein U5K75_02960 [Ahrensia sp.]|nr:hypothetical protein [Ahrensia sp.]
MPIVVPLQGHYMRSREHEARRGKFYAQMNMVYGLSGWAQPNKALAMPAIMPGRDGILLNIKPRDQKSTVDININSGPFEFLRETRRLAGPEDIAGAEMARSAAGEKFRSAAEGSHVSPMRSVDWSAVRSGGFGGRNVADHKFDCMAKTKVWRAMMNGTDLYALLESVIVYDRFSAIIDGHRMIKPSAIEAVRAGLDIVALDLDMITARSFRSRWSFLPSQNGVITRRFG